MGVLYDAQEIVINNQLTTSPEKISSQHTYNATDMREVIVTHEINSNCADVTLQVRVILYKHHHEIMTPIMNHGW